ncbi:nuclear transport factor 2 family protein [Priestia megaterium]|uniref:nuclear transport factor 2 family protein n=1 Tax=Priestia megaterium TaxID=1404 RepID=UPI00272F94DC|nr:nuclear transport factor 2 family protein [Priestia megaterium]MDP1383366.1 nuclear transport factor 2 family protein [Priestia megaterium]MDP1427514.1 nuclear transport factor 2 family protein [Priestia megaterium]
MNTNETNSALKIARTYFEAMANQDVEGIMALAADDIVCDSPAGHLEGTQSFRGFQEGFARMINKLTLVTAFGNDEQAVIIYEADTLPVKNATVVEYIAVKNEKMASTQVIYDATPFLEYMASQPKH